MKSDALAKVVFEYGGRRQLISETFNKPYAFCKWWIKENGSDPKYIRGRLRVVSAYVKIK